jgi:hypothetical protein
MLTMILIEQQKVREKKSYLEICILLSKEKTVGKNNGNPVSKGYAKETLLSILVKSLVNTRISPPTVYKRGSLFISC